MRPAGSIRPAPAQAPYLYRTGADRRSRQYMWLGLAAALLLLPLLSQPGRYVPDSRDAIYFSPGSYLAQSFTLWHSSPFLGSERRDSVIVPMAATIGLLRFLGLPVWAAERLWHGLLMFAAAGGMVLLVDELRGRRTVLAPLTAGLLYVLTPYVFGFGLATTGAFLPYVFLPLLLFATLRGVRRPGLAGPALFGLVTFLMGGGNGAVQVYAFATALALGLWLVFVDRSVPLRRGLLFGAAALGFVVGLNAYWLVLLRQSPEVGNQLTFGEQPSLINVASSFSESIRGLGFWAYYGGDQSGPWVRPVQPFITSPAFIVAGFAVPAGAFLSAWLTRWRLRLFFVLLAIAAVIVMSGVFPVRSPMPFGRLLFHLYAKYPSTLGLRTTYAFGGALSVALAVLAGIGLEEGWRWVTTSADRARYRGWLAAVAAFVVLTLGFPVWAGRLYDHVRSAGPIPSYWQRALGDLKRREVGYRALFVPGALSSRYRWGALHEGLAEASTDLSAVHRTPAPVVQRYGTNLLAALEQSYVGHEVSPGTASLLRYMGVRDVVLQNDIDWERSHTARPLDFQTLAQGAGLDPLAAYGSPGQNVAARAQPGLPVPAAAEAERDLPPVQVLTVPDPIPIVHADPAPPLVVSGDAFGLASLARGGMLDRNPPILYAANLTPAQLGTILADDPTLVVTDSNRRRVWFFEAVVRPYSYTLPAGRTIGGRPTGFVLFRERPDTQSAAVYQGAVSITASGYGSLFDQEPEFRPSNAFDGDPRTWWLVGGYQNPLGAWVRVGLSRPGTLASLTLVAPSLGFGRRVSRARIQFSQGPPVVTAVGRGRTEVRFAPRTSTFVRVTIAGVSGRQTNPVGFGDVEIPGLTVREAIRVPTDLFDTARRAPGAAAALARLPLVYAFERARDDRALSRDEELGLDRIFVVPAERSFRLGGAVHVAPGAPDNEIDRLAGWPKRFTITSSSRFAGVPGFRGSAAFDGDPKTAWVAQRPAGQWVQITFPRRGVHRIVLKTQISPNRSRILSVRATFSDGSSVTGRATNLFDGRIAMDFPPRVTSEVRITVTHWLAPVFRQQSPPVGIAEVDIPGLRLPRIDQSRRLPCTSVPGFSLDGAPLSLQPVGTVAQFLRAQSMPLATCKGDPLPIGAGTHELVANGPLQPDAVTLSSASTGQAEPARAKPHLDVHSTRTGYAIDVTDASAPFYLSLGQNWAPGWTAFIAGRSLGPPLVLDGYSAGWRIDRAGSYRMIVRYAPQGPYDMGLGVTAISLIAVGLVFGIPLLRKRTRRKAPR